MEFCASDRTTYEKFADGKVKDISEEIPFELAQGWAWTRIGAVFYLQAGKNISSQCIKEHSAGYPYPCYGGNGVRGYVKKSSHKGIHAVIGRQGALCGNLNLTHDEFYATEHAVVVETFSEVTADFAYWFLKQMNLNQYATATAQPGLSVREIVDVMFPLPPLAEQKRIVAKIEELFAYVDKIGEASDGITQAARHLNKKILDLAIRGQLVPQDPNDEPASELIKRIEAAKNATKKGCKSSRTVASDRPAYEIEPPFDIPDSWEWVQLHDLGRFVGGHTPSITDSSNWENGNILWVTSKDMKQKYIRNTGCMVTEKGASELHLLPPGALLMVTRSGILRRTFPIALAAKPLTINQDQRALEFYDNAVGEYIYYCLKSLEPIILRDYRKTGTTVESIIWEKFIHLPIPLPPINEQRRIVAKVEELKAMISNLVNP